MESLGDNKFIFYFSSDLDKRKVLANEPWSFEKSLIVSSKVFGIGYVSKQSFTHASFWVQIHSIPVMCMNHEIGVQLGSKNGYV